VSADLTPTQQEVLEHETARAIFDLLQKKEHSLGLTLGKIGVAIDLRDLLPQVFRQLALLVDAQLVEQIPGTRRYRVVEK